MRRPTPPFRLLAVALSLALPIAALAAEPIHDTGRVVAVTVYQGQALVTREAKLPPAEGLIELVIDNLPERIVPGSLYAESGPGMEVRSVRYRIRPLEADNREAVRDLDGKIQEVGYELAANKRERTLLAERSRYLARLESFTTVTASAELTRGVLNAETLRDLTTLVFDEREKIADAELTLQRQADEIRGRLELLNRQRETLAGGSSRSAREAVVFVNATGPGGGALRLTYLVSGATWSPSYNLRADDDRTEVVVEYNASVEQMSGEDWTDVAMTLSTASPSLVAKAPGLEPLRIRLASAAPPASPRRSKLDLGRRQRMIAQDRGNLASARLENASGGGGGFGDGDAGGFAGAYLDVASETVRLDKTLNDLSCALQVLDLAGGDALANDRSMPDTANATEGISVVYRLEGRTSLPSRSDRQMIRIARLPVAAEFYRVATPLLTSYVYEEARLVNRTGLVLLAGPAATFHGDRFVGRGEVPSVAVGEPLTVGLGIDESLRARRELVDRTQRVQGGNRVVRFDYRLTVENFGDTPVTVRLRDRLPRSEKGEVKVTLVESDPARVAPEDGRREGIVRWDLDAPPRDEQSGEAAVEYTLEIEHDKNLTIEGATAKG